MYDIFVLQPFATGSQAGSHIGAPTNPYGAAQFIPLMTHQPPSQLHLQGLQQVGIHLFVCPLASY